MAILSTMAHDANFVGNRLRLSAFLLCVEDGEMPARPSRFRRRSQIRDGSTTSHATPPPQVDYSVPVLQAYKNSPVLASKAASEEGAVESNADEEAAITGKPLEAGIDVEKTLSKSPVHVPSLRDIPHSPTPDYRLIPVRTNDQNSHNDPGELQHRSELERISHSKREAWFVTTTIMEKASGEVQGLSSTRKRRLPVHELALLRTTTLDGLPLPSDAVVGFATPITVVDPIEDSQVRSADILSNRALRNLIITKRRPSPHISQPSNTDRSLNTRPGKTTAKPFQGPLSLSTDKTHHYPGFRDAHDGFVGHELQLTSTERSSRRKKPCSVKRQKPSMMRELALGPGSLPVPAGCDMAISTISTPNVQLIPSRPGDTQLNPRVE